MAHIENLLNQIYGMWLMLGNINQIYQNVLNRIDIGREYSDDELYEVIDECILSARSNKYLLSDKIAARRDIFDRIRGYGILQELLDDKDISEIMINGISNIFVEKNGVIYRTDKRFDNEEQLNDLIQKIVSKVNRRVNESCPISDSRLEDGSRINIVLKPVAINGPIITIRKFPSEKMTMEKLIELGAIDRDIADKLKMFVECGYNIFISGGTSSGKTTFLNALSDFVPKNERIITIEDSAELQINGVDNLVSLEVKQGNAEGDNAISIRDLIKSSLRMRPDRIIVGEVRGAEALDMIQSMNTGHSGSLSTGHANSARDMLARIETMVLMGTDMPIPAIRGQIASALDLIIHLERLADKSRKVVEITEVLDYQDGVIKTNDLYIYDFKEQKLTRTDNEFVNRYKLNSVSKGEVDV